MVRLIKIPLILILLYVTVMLGSGLLIKGLLSGWASGMLRQELSNRFPVEVTLGDGDLALAQWFLLRPSITIRNLSLGNPEGFSTEPMIQASEISAQVPLTTLLSRRPRVERITIVEPVLRIETNRYGRSNLASIAPETAVPEAGPSAEGTEATVLAIDSLTISGGSLQLVDLPSGETLALEGLDVRLRNFSTTSMFDLEIDASPFGGEQSRISFESRAGPFLQESFPAAGDLSITIAPTEFPPEFRTRVLGESLRDPGPGSLFTVAAGVKGDLIGTLQGAGRLAFDDFEFGRDAEHRLPLDGDVPLELTVQGALNSPTLDLTAKDAALDLGDGHFKGDLQLAVGLRETRGSIGGAIENVDIDQILSTFTESAGWIYGLAAIPRFRLRFSGANGDELMNSLNGAGQVTLDQGRITFLDTIDSVLSAAETVLKISGLTRAAAEQAAAAPAEEQVEAPAGQTGFTTLSGDVTIANRRVDVTDIDLKSPSGDVTGSGSFTFDSVMDFDLVAHLSGHVADALGGRPDESGTIRAIVPFEVTGTFSDPRVKPDFAHLAVGAASRVIQEILKRRQGAEGDENPSILDIFKRK